MTTIGSAHLDEILPEYDHWEKHRVWIRRPPHIVWRAVNEAQVVDLRVAAGFLRVRNAVGGRSVDPKEFQMKIVEAFSPRRLCEVPEQVLVLGDIASYLRKSADRPPIPRGDLEAFRSFGSPGYTKVAMDFRLQPQDDGTWLSTETRIRGLDAATRRKFALYWAAVGPFSGLTRREILAAMKHRANVIARG